MKKILLFFFSVCLTLAACKKTDTIIENTTGIASIVNDTTISGFLPNMPDSVLQSFRTIYDIDELVFSDLFPPPGITGASYDIPNFPAHPEITKGQDGKNSCLAWAGGYFALSYYYNKALGRPYTASNLLSPDFIYNSLTEKNIITCNEGIGPAEFRDFLITDGTCTISDFPIEKFSGDKNSCNDLKKTTPEHKDAAKIFKIKDLLYVKRANNPLINIENFRKCISNNVPVILGIKIDEGFSVLKKDEIYKQHIGKWIPTNLNDPEKAGHAVVLIGYDDDKKAFKFQNSWGISWGDKGKGWLAYDYLSDALAIPGGFVLKVGVKNVYEQTGVFFTNFHDNTCLGGGPNTGVFGGNMSGVNIVNWSGLNIARFTQQNHSRIEYNLNNTIPGYPDQINQEGTFEMTANIQNAYLYNNYQLENDSIATLFTTDNSGADVNWPGSMRLLASKSGTIQFVINTQKYGNAPNILEAKNTHFRFKQWHRIGVSYGSQGMHIMLDGKIVASNINFKQKIANGGGHSLQNDRPTIGEAKSYFPWGNYQYGRGFEGYLYKVRSSAIQSDFKLAL